MRLPFALPAAALVAAGLLAPTRYTAAQQPALTIRNDGPRVDVNGDTIDVHDGRVIRFSESPTGAEEPTYYWYGTAYGTTTGFTRANEYRVYSSPDMQAWTPHGAILPDAASGVYYRPHVIHDAANGRYVLWYNWYPVLWQGRFGVATSDSPLGPFEVVDDDVQVAHSELGVGDFNLFVDDDGTGYLMYNTIAGHRLSVERLADDYLTSTLDNGGFITQNAEAGSVFRRDSTYYLLTDYTCCFCTQGSGARVYTASDPLDSFALRQNINRYPGTPAPMLTDGDERPTVYQSIERREDGTFPAVQLNLGRDTALGGMRVLQYTGNRAGQCGDTLATRVHDPRAPATYSVEVMHGGEWAPARGMGPDVVRGALTNAITHALTGLGEAVRVRFDTAYPYDVIQLVELRVSLANGDEPGPREGAHAYVLDVDEHHTPPIVPAQQTFVMPIELDGEMEYLWMGDLWGSAPDNVKGHDVQYWSSPLEFYENGLIRPLAWEQSWER